MIVSSISMLTKDDRSMIDWDKWNLGWATGLPKNQMWAKIRSGKTDERGEPIFQHEEREDTTSIDGAVGDVLAEHRFVSPAIAVVPGDEHCFCGWTGKCHADHLDEKVALFCSVTPDRVVEADGEEPVEPKKAAKKAPAKKAE